MTNCPCCFTPWIFNHVEDLESFSGSFDHSKWDVNPPQLFATGGTDTSPYIQWFRGVGFTGFSSLSTALFGIDVSNDGTFIAITGVQNVNSKGPVALVRRSNGNLVWELIPTNNFHVYTDVQINNNDQGIYIMGGRVAINGTSKYDANGNLVFDLGEAHAVGEYDDNNDILFTGDSNEVKSWNGTSGINNWSINLPDNGSVDGIHLINGSLWVLLTGGLFATTFYARLYELNPSTGLLLNNYLVTLLASMGGSFSGSKLQRHGSDGLIFTLSGFNDVITTPIQGVYRYDLTGTRTWFNNFIHPTNCFADSQQIAYVIADVAPRNGQFNNIVILDPNGNITATSTYNIPSDFRDIHVDPTNDDIIYTVSFPRSSPPSI